MDSKKKNHQQKWLFWWHIVIHPPDTSYADNITDEDSSWEPHFPCTVVNLSHSYSHLLRFSPFIPLPFPLSLSPSPRRERQMARSGKVRWGGEMGSSRRIEEWVRKGGHKWWVGGGLIEKQSREEWRKLMRGKDVIKWLWEDDGRELRGGAAGRGEGMIYVWCEKCADTQSTSKGGNS